MQRRRTALVVTRGRRERGTTECLCMRGVGGEFLGPTTKTGRKFTEPHAVFSSIGAFKLYF